jgi:hypothetical protein
VSVVTNVASFLQCVVAETAFGNSCVTFGALDRFHWRVRVGFVTLVTATGAHRSVDHLPFRLWAVAGAAAGFFLEHGEEVGLQSAVRIVALDTIF